MADTPENSATVETVPEPEITPAPMPVSDGYGTTSIQVFEQAGLLSQEWAVG